MSIFIRCEWMPRADASLEEGIAEATGLLGDPILATITGTQWYRLGRSKAEALSRPMSREDLREVRTWRRVPLIPGQTVYAADLWNGRDDPAGANLSIAIQMPPTDIDTFVVSGLNADYLRSSGVSWKAVLAFAESLSQKLGGIVRIASHELLDLTKDCMAGDAQKGSYAAFWGVDRSGHNTGYHALMKTGSDAPFSCVAANSWEEVNDPEPTRVQEIARLLGQ